eukprot:c15370_g1_i1 orf=448-744(-)
MLVSQIAGLQVSSPMFGSPFEAPLSMVLPPMFFSLGPWRSPLTRITGGTLQIDLLFLQFQVCDILFLGTNSTPVIRFMFQTLHDHLWDKSYISNILFT